MGRLDQFEFPLPRIHTDVKCIELEASGSYVGQFTITNIGGCELSGHITANSKFISFSSTSFEGNHNTITYTLHLEEFKQNERITTSVYMMSNGGEITIPITITISAPAIKTRDGVTLSTLSDFCAYAQKSPVAARNLFHQWEFSLWLVNMGYAHMKLYDHFTNDPVKERALDNFLMLNNLKSKATISIDKKLLCFTATANSKEVLVGCVTIGRSTWGYTDLSLRIVGGETFLALEKNKIISADFSKEGYYELNVLVYCEAIKEPFQMATVEISSANEVLQSFCVQVQKQPQLKASLSKTSFYSEDKGFIQLHNHTGKDLMIMIHSHESFVKFDAKRYFVGAYAEIPFGVKMSGLQLAQMAFNKPFSVTALVDVVVVSDVVSFQKTLNINVGGL